MYALLFFLFLALVPVQGDANEDGEITHLDAEIIMQYVVGKPVEPENVARYGDADCNGKIESRDALIVLKYLADEDVSAFCVGTEWVD